MSDTMSPEVVESPITEPEGTADGFNVFNGFSKPVDVAGKEPIGTRAHGDDADGADDEGAAAAPGGEAAHAPADHSMPAYDIGLMDPMEEWVDSDDETGQPAKKQTPAWRGSHTHFEDADEEADAVARITKRVSSEETDAEGPDDAKEVSSEETDAEDREDAEEGEGEPGAYTCIEDWGRLPSLIGVQSG